MLPRPRAVSLVTAPRTCTQCTPVKLRSQDGPGTWRGVEADGIVVLPGSMIWKTGRVSSVTAVAPRFQVRSLETTSTTRRSGRGPGSSLKSTRTFVRTFYCLTGRHSIAIAIIHRDALDLMENIWTMKSLPAHLENKRVGQHTRCGVTND